MDNILKRSPVTRTQYAALPYRIEPDGGLAIMLITSRETRRWVIPKGWPMRGVKPHGVAAREAYEEAGVEGEIGRRSIGFYYYHKRLKDGSTVPVCVEVFPLMVSRQHERWPEQGQRTSRWAHPEEAAALVEEESLSGLVRAFGEIFAPAGVRWHDVVAAGALGARTGPLRRAPCALTASPPPPRPMDKLPRSTDPWATPWKLREPS